MRYGLGMALLGLLAVVLVLPATGQDPGRPRATARRARDIWSFSVHKTRARRGERIPIVPASDQRAAGKWLVVTNLGLRMPMGVRVRLVERIKGQKKRRTVVVRRAAPFNIDIKVSDGKWIGSDYVSQIGMKFAPGSTVDIEVVGGSGEIFAHAEGYWADP